MNTLHWAPCELHCHTCHSDGKFTPKSLLQTAVERRLEGIALTDHNTMTGAAAAEKLNMLPVLKGMEWTTYFGHMPVLGCDAFVDWRDASLTNIDAKLREIHAHGGVCGIAHPFQLGSPICSGGHWDFQVKDYGLLHYIEVFSEGNAFLNTPNRRAISFWHSLLDAGYQLAPTFGRDWHGTDGDLVLSACTYLGVEQTVTAESMKQAIRKGKTLVTMGPLLTMQTERGDTYGDTVPAGEHTLSFQLSTERMRCFADAKSIRPSYIRLVSNGEAVALKIPVTQNTDHVPIQFESGHWYSAELWGSWENEADTLLSVASPVYIQSIKEER